MQPLFFVADMGQGAVTWGAQTVNQVRHEMTSEFVTTLTEIQPSQLFISSERLSRVREGSDPLKTQALQAIPVKRLGDRVVFTDGHTRAFAAHEAGLSEVRVFWDEDELDWEAYEICVRWCQEAGIHTIADLRDKVVSSEEYDILWLKRCEEMHQWLEGRRGKDAGPC